MCDPLRPGYANLPVHPFLYISPCVDICENALQNTQLKSHQICDCDPHGVFTAGLFIFFLSWILITEMRMNMSIFNIFICHYIRIMEWMYYLKRDFNTQNVKPFRKDVYAFNI